MKINRLKLLNFRNYLTVDLSFNSGIQFFCGNNAQGKTNLLESIYFAALGKSFKASNDEDVIAWNESETYVGLYYTDNIATHNIQMIINREKPRETILNDCIVKRNEIIGKFNAVLFCPEDLLLIKGAPSLRRKFLDFSISQVDRMYYNNLIKYNRAILQRNNILKGFDSKQKKDTLLDVWDDQLSSLAFSLISRRKIMIDKLSEIAQTIYYKVTNGAEEFSAHYFVFGYKEKDECNYMEWYKNKLRETRDYDIQRGNTGIGPHKDDLTFTINSYDAKQYASQGQQRTAVLSMKLAETEIIYQIKNEYPVLLLDDVMSELDILRREKLLEYIETKVQTFITGTETFIGMEKTAAELFIVTGGTVKNTME